MNQKERDSLTALLHSVNDRHQALSHMIHWTAADSECLDNLVDSKDQQKDIADRITKATGSRAFTMYLPSFLAYKSWQRTKAVYSFNREFIDTMSQTDDTTILIPLLERLPFRDMLFLFPDGALPTIKDEDTAGIYVHIESHPGLLWTAFNYIDRKNDNGAQIYPGISFAFQITNGMKVSQIFETPQYLEGISTYKQTVSFDRHLNEQETGECILAVRKALNTAINLMYYLSSEEPDIKQIKRHKKPRKTSSNQREDDDPAIKLHEVGTAYAEIVSRKLYLSNNLTGEDTDLTEDDDDENNEDAAVRTVKHRKKRRPHVRRAHFQHYWTGEGHTIPILRWKSDLFVGSNRDDQATIVYDVAKISMKGKRNPNTSKKKRNK